ncbi:SIMPL domain-containing protein [Bacillus solitudinis]|uniref:SIMPL domain-containing protein n=1 Tax=Bacillus solitudinis TaxID=2014074 RepID=UPI000C246D23|nr:SIMPL domain-containing protein [Bacillus solitudinis]
MLEDKIRFSPLLPQKTRQEFGENTIKVIGKGTISVTPNRAIVILGVITEDKSVSEAQRMNAASLRNIISTLTAIGVLPEDVQTSTYRIDSQYDYVDGKQLFRNYRVTHLLSITINDINLTGTLIDAAVEQGANSVPSIQFTVTDQEEPQNQALALAVMNGTSKAQTIADSLDVSLIETPKSIVEREGTQSRPFDSYVLGASTETPIQPGSLNVTATVDMEFSYVR